LGHRIEDACDDKLSARFWQQAGVRVAFFDYCSGHIFSFLIAMFLFVLGQLFPPPPSFAPDPFQIDRRSWSGLM
jgi:hypothetical protein